MGYTNTLKSSEWLLNFLTKWGYSNLIETLKIMDFSEKIDLLKELEEYKKNSIERDILYNETINSILSFNDNQLLDILVMGLFPGIKITNSTIKCAEWLIEVTTNDWVVEIDFSDITIEKLIQLNQQFDKWIEMENIPETVKDIIEK